MPLAFPVPLGSLPTPAAGTWRSLFPEFNTAPDVLIQSRLDLAQLQIDPAIWGDRAGEGQAWLAAHLMATAPGGQFARLLSKEGSSTYKVRYDEMVILVAGLIFRVV